MGGKFIIYILVAGHEPSTDIGPVISPASKERIERLIQTAVDQGAHLLLDGRNATVGTIAS